MRLNASRLFAPAVVEQCIPAPAPAIYDVLTDPNTYPDWLVGADHIRGADPEFPKPGTTFDHSVGPAEPLTIDDETESVGADENRHLALRVHAGPFHARVDFDLAPQPDGRTRVRFSEKPIGFFGAFTPLLRPTLRARNRRSLTKLCELVLQDA